MNELSKPKKYECEWCKNEWGQEASPTAHCVRVKQWQGNPHFNLAMSGLSLKVLPLVCAFWKLLPRATDHISHLWFFHTKNSYLLINIQNFLKHKEILWFSELNYVNSYD